MVAERAPRSRLPAPPGQWLFRDPIARLWQRPWFDRAALNLITQWYLPLSRAWAAALTADGDVGRFWQALPGRPPRNGRFVAKILSETSRRRREYAEAARDWEQTFFTSPVPETAVRISAEVTRRRAAERLMRARAGFLPLALQTRLPAVAFDIPAPAELARRHRHRLRGGAFPTPETVRIEDSARVPGPTGAQHWLRFPATVAGASDLAWARVFEPEAAVEPSTLIFLHGITMEMEFWPDSRDPIPQLTRRGLRVVRVEGPWHGRRRPEGFYGGEPVLARAPLGMVELFQAWVPEIGQLIRWARETSSGPVAVAGISLGALASQLLASVAAGWPDELRPDALLLCCTSGDVTGTLDGGGLAAALDLPRRLAARGWDAAALAPWRPLVEPGDRPAMPGRRIVMVLGSKDVVTPYPGGLALAERWAVPAANRFVWARGHFSAGLGLTANEGPISRLVAALNEARQG